MASYRETVHLGRDNEITLALAQGDTVLSASGVTRCLLVCKRPGLSDIRIDSQALPALFDLNDSAPVNGRATGILVLKLGGSLTLVPALYDVDVYLYDAHNNDGVFWDTFEMLVKDGDP